MAKRIVPSCEDQSKCQIQFGYLTRIGPWFKHGHVNHRCVVRCVCGQCLICEKSNLKNGNSRSCGCQRKRLVSVANRKHGLSVTNRVEWQIWKGMKRRCYSVQSASYKRYGARGIVVCDRWLNSAENFFQDMGPRPSPKHSLDRIDNDGNYEPGNCRWATNSEQGNNKRNNRKLCIGGVTKTMAEWSAEPGAVPYANIHSRITVLGWDDERAVFEPVA